MAKARLCAVEGCGNIGRVTRGMCSKHYARLMRHGIVGADPARTQPGEAIAWLRAHVMHDDATGCVIWPFAVNRGGYGNMRIEGKYNRAHRVMCAMAHGDPPDGKDHVAHSCANRACVNPHHLRWASKAENEADKVAHGSSNRGSRHGLAKLSEGDVLAIRLSHGTMSLARIAAKHGVSYSTVWEIVNGKRWAWLK